MNKFRLFVVIIGLFLLSNSVFAQDKLIDAHFQNLSFKEFCASISQTNAVKIYYPAKYFTDKTINIDQDQILISEAVKLAIDNDSFQVVFWNNSIVITNGKIIPEKLELNDLKDIPADNEVVEPKEEYFKSNKAGVQRKVIVGTKGVVFGKTQVVLNVHVTDEQNGDNIPGATVYIESLKKGTITNDQGIAKLSLLPNVYSIRIMYMGMKEQEYQLHLYSSGSFTVEMFKQGIELSSVDIFGDRQMNMRKKDPGLEKISAKLIKEMPVMVGEPDIVRSASMLPGIISVGEGSAGLNVRGGGSDQNAFYLNDIPIFNTGHLFGFFPAFNADLIKDFTISKGYIPAKYGGKLSSIFDIETRKASNKKFSLHGGISPMAANLVLSVPIIDEKLSLIVSGRKSYSDWILRQINDYDISHSSAQFSDISVGLYYDLPNTQISLFGYHSKDFFAYSNVNEYQYSNDGISLKIAQRYSKKLRANYSFVIAQYWFNTQDFEEFTKAYEHSYTVGQDEFKAEYFYDLSEHQQLTGGYHFVFYNLDRGIVNPIGKSIRVPVDLGTEKGMENAVFIADKISPWPWLDLNLGMRFSIYNPLGPKDVYLYSDGKTIDNQYIYDTLNFADNEVINAHYFPELRLAANITISKKSSLKASFTQMHQSLFMLNTTVTIAPSSQWKLADYHISPSHGNQYSLGFFHSFTKYGFESSMEAFYKQTKDYTEFRDGANFLNSAKTEQSVLQGNQNAYGLELMLRRSGVEYRFTGWIAYTYSRSFIQIYGDENWQDINKGMSYPSSYDVPHALNALLNIRLSKRLSFSTTVNYQSGRPITTPISIYYVNGVPFVDYSERNAFRIPDYFRVDASLIVEGSLKRKKLIHSSLVFSLYNITGRDNPFSVYFVANDVGVDSYQYSVISVPVFTATWIFKFGNYDAL